MSTAEKLAVLFSREGPGKAIKEARRAFRMLRDRDRREATLWCRTQSTSLDAIATSLDAALWAEAKVVQRQTARLRRDRLAAARLHGHRSSDIGGGPGNLALLYFLVRLLRPRVVVETGVASGASSSAILQALDFNDCGSLFSSDLAGVIPREFAGICVDQHLRRRWHLYHDGDRVNIPRIVDRAESIDLLHYDSAKDAEEMEWVIAEVVPAMNRFGVIVLDDIDRHSFMRDFVKHTDLSWSVFGSVGVIGLEEAVSQAK